MKKALAAGLLLSLGSTSVYAMDKVRVESNIDAAVAKYAVTGRGVIVALLDRGIDLRGVSIGAGTSSPGGGGRYGLFYSAVPAGSEATASAWLYGLQQNDENRTNLALVNVGSVDATSDAFHIDLYDGTTGQKAGSTDVTVPAKGFLQIGTILAAYAPGVTGGYALVTRTSGSNPWVAYAVINDGGQPGQRSGDGAFVSAVVGP